MTNKEFYYVDSVNSKQGPVDSQDLLALAQKGIVTPSTLVWEHGTPDWVQARTIEILATVYAPASHALLKKWMSMAVPAVIAAVSGVYSGATASRPGYAWVEPSEFLLIFLLVSAVAVSIIAPFFTSWPLPTKIRVLMVNLLVSAFVWFGSFILLVLLSLL
ncbi:MAG: DUF4339 domain-containing protein [Spirochaetales bacterium]|nr:DUF4339 domain-containing protein [Spirochaetales bacterium]